MKKVFWLGMVMISMAIAAACNDESQAPEATSGASPDANTATATATSESPTPDSAHATGVAVNVDRLSYRTGEQVVVVLRNNRAEAIYAPTGRAPCSLVILERLEAGVWQPVGSCPPGETAAALMLSPRSEVTAPLVFTGAVPDLDGPFVSEPVVPLTSVPLSMLPTATADPSRIFPEGGETQGRDGLPIPGVYRMGFRFTAGSASGTVEIVYSEEFTLTD